MASSEIILPTMVSSTVTTSTVTTGNLNSKRPQQPRSSSSFSKVIRKIKSLGNMGNASSRSASPTLPSPQVRPPSAIPLSPTTLLPSTSPSQSISNLSIGSTLSRPRASTNSSLKGSMFSSLFGSGNMARSSSSSSTNSFNSEFGVLFDGAPRQRGLSLPVPPMLSRNRSGSSSSILPPRTLLESSTPPPSPHHNLNSNIYNSPLKQPSHSLAKVIRSTPPLTEESPQDYLERLALCHATSSLASILSVSGELFFSTALSVYLDSFDFTFLALDIALRKFLLSTSLPKETQQIDRVIEAFSIRYHQQNSNLGISKETFYLLTFSLIMLSTDLWNGSVRHKMSKTEYLKNCSVDASVEVAFLEYLYDQTSNSPFIFAERDSTLDDNEYIPVPVTPSLSQQKRNAGPPANLKSDVFSQGLIPINNPFSFTGIRLPFFDASKLHTAYVNAPILRLPEGNGMRIIKLGQLNRKDDLNSSGERSSSRKWRAYSVVLSGSQLLFFKSPTFAALLQESLDNAARSNNDATSLLNGSFSFKPEETVSLKNCIALYAGSEKYDLVFRLFFSEKAECLLQASSEDDLSSWITSINFAATFKSAKIRIGSPLISTSPSTPSSSTVNLPDFNQTFRLPASDASGFQIRSESLKIKIVEYENEISHLKQCLQGGLKRARSIAICSPWKTSTRDSLMDIVPALAKQIRGTRTGLAKLVCYREVLSKELLVETRQASAVKRFTLFSDSQSNFNSAVESFTDEQLRHLPPNMSRSISDTGDMRFRSLPSSRKNSIFSNTITSLTSSTPSLLLP